MAMNIMQLIHRYFFSSRILFMFFVIFVITILTTLGFSLPAFAKSETFACITDTHIGLNEQNASDTAAIFAYAKKQKDLVAVVHAGDITNLGGKAEYEKYKHLYKKSKLKATMIQAIGNHDNASGGNKTWLKKGGYKKYTKLTGVNYFKKILNGGKITTVHYFSHANVITIGQGFRQTSEGVFPESMISWLDQQLKATHRAGKFAVVVCHYPPTNAVNPKKYNDSRMPRVIGVCQSYPNVIYICGHNHDYPKSREYNASYKLKTAKVSPYTREGINSAQASYPITLLGLDSVSRIKGVFGKKIQKDKAAMAEFMTFKDNGSVSVVKRNMTKKKNAFKKTFKKKTSSITVAAESATAGTTGAQISYKIDFSDKKSYGGVKSGGTFSLSLGQSKAFKSIPSGVLVTVTPVSATTGWKLAPKQEKEVTTSNTTITFIHSCDNPNSEFSISYKGLKNGSTILSPTSFTSKELPLALGTATNPVGYTFKGWNTRSDFTGNTISQIETGTNNNVTLYAQYTPNQYSVRFNGNGATWGSMSLQTMTYDQKTTLSSNTYKKTGYEFCGWARHAVSAPLDDNSIEFFDNAKVSNLSSGNTVNLYAVWDEAQNLNANSGSLKSGYWAAYDANGVKITSSYKSQSLVPIASIRPSRRVLAAHPENTLNKEEYKVTYMYNANNTRCSALITSTGINVKDAFIIQFAIA